MVSPMMKHRLRPHLSVSFPPGIMRAAMTRRNKVMQTCTPWTVVFRSVLMSLIMTFMFEPAKLQMNWARASGTSIFRSDEPETCREAALVMTPARRRADHQTRDRPRPAPVPYPTRRPPLVEPGSVVLQLPRCHAGRFAVMPSRGRTRQCRCSRPQQVVKRARIRACGWRWRYAPSFAAAGLHPGNSQRMGIGHFGAHWHLPPGWRSCWLASWECCSP